MTMIKPMKLEQVSKNEPYPFTVISRRRDQQGFPINDRHTLWESCVMRDEALDIGTIRSNEGWWVDVFENVAYNVVED